MAITSAPAPAVAAPARMIVCAWAGERPPIAKRVIATVAAKIAGATLVSVALEPSSSWANTALQLWWAFSLAKASAPRTPISSSGSRRPVAADCGSALVRSLGGSARSIATPAASESAATPRNGTLSGRSAPAARPVSRLETTTKAEKVPCARVMTGRCASCSARPATEFIATSAAPLAAPATARPALRAIRSRAANASPAPARPSSAMTNAATRRPQRSSARPTSSIAGSAPAPTNSRASPSSPSSTPAWSCTRGTDAPHTPQNEPKAAKAT